MKASVEANLQTPEWLSADRPITGRAQDKLGRSGFAEAIAAVIRGWQGKDSLVIALYGPGGTGKSSIKNMIIEAIHEMAEPSPVTEFNPWQFANREQMTAAFFDQIGIILNRETGISRLWRWQRYGAYLTASRNLVELLRKLLLWVFSVCGLSLLASKGQELPAMILRISASSYLRLIGRPVNPEITRQASPASRLLRLS